MLRISGLSAAPGLTRDRTAALSRLQTLSGRAFDAEFTRMAGVQEHQNAVALFERASREVQEPDLRAWFSRQLPELQGRLQAAQNLAGTLAG